MKITDIAIHADGISEPYKAVREITAKVSKGSLFSKSPTIEDVNFKLQEEAAKFGANAVMNVTPGLCAQPTLRALVALG
ncbi:MAG: hypothetical protein ABSB35_42325 [Bryobacteraceae bacterium]